MPVQIYGVRLLKSLTNATAIRPFLLTHHRLYRVVTEHNYEIWLLHLSLTQRGLHHGPPRRQLAPILVVLAEPGRVDSDDRNFDTIGS